MRSMVEGAKARAGGPAFPLRHAASAARHLPQEGEETDGHIAHAGAFAFFTCDSRAVRAPGVMPSIRPA